MDEMQLGTQMQARKLLEKHAASRGYPGQANWAHWALHSQYLDLAKHVREKLSFWEFVIQELGK
jgi:hypothetical protein